MTRPATDPAHFRRVALAHERAQRFTGEDDPECSGDGCTATVQPGEGLCSDCRDDRLEEEDSDE